MTFQIVRLFPIYHPSTDAMIGTGSDPLPMSYQTRAFAIALAGRLEQEDHESCGDDHFVVVAYGASPFGKFAQQFNTKSATMWASEEMPF